MRHLVRKLFTLALFFIVPVLMSAQEVASVTGVVTDPSGAVIADVNVTLVNTQTNTTYQAKTNSIGAYTIAKVLPGPGYKMTFKREGFDTVVVNDLYIAVGTVRTQNAELKIGTVNETVEVSAVGQGVTLNTSDSTVATNFNMSTVADLPVQIRDNPSALLQLQPGVVNATGGSDGLSSRAGSVTGARGDQNNITLDGLDVNDFATGQAFSTVANAPVDSVQEFRGETAGTMAASGRGSGAQIQMVTKSGTNAFHGSAIEINRNTSLAANSWFNNNAGIAKAPLIRNQFGANIGGPIKKDKLFFFFDYNGRRDAYGVGVAQTVPLDSFRNGTINYILAKDKVTGAACASTSRLSTTPNCIGTATSAQVAALDPKGIGFDQALLTFINQRYPHANDLTAGDGINTGIFRFNAPVHRTGNGYVSKIDFNINDKMKMFGRFSILRDRYGDSVNYVPIQFPGDPLTKTIENTSYAYVIGHTWTLSPTQVNQFTYGETVSQLAFPTHYNPAGTTRWSFGGLTAPYLSQSSQKRKNPIPIFRDDFTWQRGNHNIQFGGTFKPIKTTSTLVGDFNSVGVGLGGGLSSFGPIRVVSPFRPADIRISGTAGLTNWDTFFPVALGRLSSISSNYNYDNTQTVLAQGSGATRQYRYFEYESYLQDSWKVTPALTLTYGVRYQYYSVPFEVNGAQAIQNFGFDEYLAGRVAQGLAGVSGDSSVPIVSYDLGGKANNARGLYEPNLLNFAPRFAFAYSPSANGGILGRIFGDRKTVIRGGSGLIYDHPVINALNFIQDQNSYMFQGSSSITYGTGDATSALTNDPRFAGIGTIPTPAAAPTIARPYTPFVSAGAGTGLADNEFNYAIDPNLKSPYSIMLSFGFQRELPGHFVVESTYVGRLGRRLIAQADASQVVNFKDPASGQMLSQALANVTTALVNGVAVPAQPFFENQIGVGATAAVASGTSGGELGIGDIADAVQYMHLKGWLPQNVGMPAQFAGNTYITNKGSSTYHGLLTSLHKNMSHGLKFDLNYTFSHSIDNTSGIANSISSNSGMGFVCDATNLRVCRGNSDFDIKHIVNGTVIYDLPFGKGKAFGGSAHGVLNQVIGGWTISGIPVWRSGFAFSDVSGAYLMGYANNAPAIFNGDHSALKVDVHKLASGQVTMFADPTAAQAAYSNPVGFEMGSRNNLRGPGYFNVDMSIIKRFPVTERIGVKFRADGFNAFNHPSFGLPGGGTSNAGADITSPNFGQITSTSSTARVVQFSLQVEF